MKIPPVLWFNSLRPRSASIAFLLALLAVFVASAPSSAEATVLTFDIAGLANGQPVPQAYGDNVSSATMGGFSYGSQLGFTPNVTVTYGNGAPALWATGYGDLSNVLFEDQDSTGILTITLIADPGYTVQFGGVQLAAFTSAFTNNPMILSFRLFNDANQVISENTNFQVTRNGHDSYSFLPSFYSALLCDWKSMRETWVQTTG